MRKDNKMMKKRMLILAISLLFLFQMIFILSAPDGPTNLTITNNQTKSATNAAMINVSGGNITTLNMSALVQNTRWKAFIGWVSGSFTLDDASSKTIYDWSLASITGEVYATRSSGTIEWGNIDCANTTHMENENTNMAHNSTQDNITATFTRAALVNHSSFVVGNVTLDQNECNGTLNTYINDTSQNLKFQEIVLFDGTDIIYSTILEPRIAGFDETTYDFQMIVPENGSASFSGKTAYYLYVELN